MTAGADDNAYVPLKHSRTVRCRAGEADYSIRMWGPDTAPPLVLLHGTRDTSVSFQFVVDAFKRDWHVIAPDLRGHGLTRSPNRNAWFHEYLADLDVILETLLPEVAVNLVGHSLGGNLAAVYAALRPERVCCMISLDAFGVLASSEAEYIQSMQAWLRGGVPHYAPQVRYESFEHMAQTLRAINPRLTSAKALYLARNISRQLDDGTVTWQFEARRRRSVPSIRTLQEWTECWRRIRAPSLWVAADEPLQTSVRANPAAFDFVRQQIGHDRIAYLPDTGHNLHHDAPERVAEVVEEFLLRAISSAAT